MSDSEYDELSSDISKYAPKNIRDRERQTLADIEQPYVSSAPISPSPSSTKRDHVRRTKPEFGLWPERVPDPPVRLDEPGSALFGRIALVVSFAAFVALLVIFAKPLYRQGAAWLLNAAVETAEVSNRSAKAAESSAPSDNKSIATTKNDQLVTVRSGQFATAATDVGLSGVANNQPATPTKIASASGVELAPIGQAQQAALAPVSQTPAQETKGVRTFVRGVTDTEIVFGMSAPFSGAAKELGQNMKLGIEAAFNAANASGGVNGRRLRLVAADDGYEPTRTAETMKRLYEKEQVFGVIGNVGTPTATVALPYALDRKMLFFGAFTGASLLRSDPPDRYVFNYRASYAEETDAVVQYLVKVRHLKATQIAVFAQQDSYGDAGFAGVAKAVRLLGGNDSGILRLNYQRNTVDVDDAVEQLRKSRIPIRAVIMVPTYRAAAKFIEKTRDLYPDMIYTSVSFVGSTALANELMLLGKRYASGVIVTQVVPPVDGHSSLVLDYKSALAKYFPGEPPDYVSLEGYVAANVLIAALKRNGPELDTEKLVQTLEKLQNFDIGLGTPVSFGRSEHQGVHKVWGSMLTDTGHYQAIDLQ
jgi:ABC-type branched-subunit amino acid transport system substrate-binding protein